MDCILWQKGEGPLSSSGRLHKPQTAKSLGSFTFSFLKPEALQQRVAGDVISRVEKKGFTIRELKLHRMTRTEAEKLYSVHQGKPFFEELVSHVTSGPVVLMIISGPNSVETMRKLVGATNPLLAEPGTIRGDLSTSITANMVHASDSIENAQREAAIFFSSDSLR